ncbi:MAG: hypothetical protein ACT4OM_11545 [Actinomycetota bacterium]
MSPAAVHFGRSMFKLVQKVWSNHKINHHWSGGTLKEKELAQKIKEILDPFLSPLHYRNLNDNSAKILPRQRSRLFLWMRAKGIGPAFAAGVPLLIALMLLAVNLWQGTLGHPHGWSLLGSDVGNITMPFLFVSAGVPSFPLLRDSVTILSLFLLGANFCVLYRQWEHMEHLVPLLIKGKVLKFVDPDSFDEAVKINNDRYKSASRFWSVYGALILALIIQAAQKNYGIYWGLGPNDDDGRRLEGWTIEAYSGWWASLPDHPLGFVAYTITVSFVLYYAIAQNQVGISFTRLFWDQRNNLQVDLDLANPDGCWGWRPLRKLMITVYFAVLANTLVLVWFFQMLPPLYPLGTTLALAAWAIPWLVTLLILGPFYLITPYRIIAPKIRTVKKDLVLAVTADGQSQSAQDSSVAKVKLMTEIAQIERIPSFPIHARAVSTFYAAEVVIGVVLIGSLLLSFSQP